MSHNFTLSKPLQRLLFSMGMATLLFLSLWLVVNADSTPLSKHGYLDFSYQGWNGAGHPTGEKPESKLWWNDGFWWAPLYNNTAGEFHIYRLNWGTQTWEDTGVVVDDRDDTKADVLWDGAVNKLYIVSHVSVQSDGEASGNSDKWARLYRYTYDPALQTYRLDPGFPVTVNQDVSETLVLAKGDTGRLWITYISRGQTPGDTPDYRVFVNSSGDDGLTWDTPSVPTLDNTPDAVHVARGDISAIVSFGNKVGIMWNNSISETHHTLHFAAHEASTTSGNWTHQSVPVLEVSEGTDDHINIKSLHGTGDGHVFAAIKTSAKTSGPFTTTLPLIALVARDGTDGSFSFHRYSRDSDKDTRPILIIDEGDLGSTNDDQVHIFVSGKESGSKICYKSLAIQTPLSNMGNFPVGDCGTSFIEDTVYESINNATSTKQNVNDTTGLVILASDDSIPTSTNVTNVYVHNAMGNPPPVVTARGPAQNATDVVLTSVVTATFSKPMDQATFNASTFIVENSAGAVAGTLSYDSGSRTATFTPDSPLNATTMYTVTLTNGIQDASGQALNEGIDAGPVIEQWSFTTGLATVQFAAANYSVNEIDGTATITVALDTQSSQVVSVTYGTSNGTATATEDYTATTGTLFFNPGELVQTFTVPIINDALQEGNESVNLTLSAPGNANLGLQSNALLTIVDDDVTAVQFDPTSFSVNEDGGQAAIKVTLSRAAAFTITVDYATSDDTATAGSDYTATSGTLTFVPGDISKTFNVPILDDTVHEDAETVNLTLSNATPPTVTLGMPGNTAVLTIVDNDPTPTVSFSSDAYSVNESDGTATVTAALSHASSFAVTVDYATNENGSTATAGSDYTAASGTLTFAPGETSQSFTVDVSNDGLDEADEVVNLRLSTPTNANLSAPLNAALTIVDDDAEPTVQFTTASITKDEDQEIEEIEVTLSAASGRLVTVDYSSSDGTAFEGSDYNAAIGTLTFAPGETSQVFEIALIDDTLDEADETVNLTLSNPTNAALGDPAAATLTIEDNDDPADGPTVQFNSATYSVNEDQGTATIQVTLNAAASSSISVDYATSDNTATAGSDYSAATGTLTFAPGETVKTFTVDITNDTEQEGNETIRLTLSNPSNAALGAPATATLTIIDDDGAPLVGFSSATIGASVDENEGTVTIEVTLNKAASSPVSVSYATSDGTATAGEDYSAASGTITFAPGETSQSFTIDITNDDEQEGDETFNLTLSNPTNALLGAQQNVVITIMDDETEGGESGGALYLPIIQR